jgi:hypothetical protein
METDEKETKLAVILNQISIELTTI